MKFIYLPSLFLTLLFLMAEGTFAQSGATNGVSQSESEKVVRKVRFSGNNNVSSYSLETLVVPAQTGSFSALTVLLPGTIPGSFSELEKSRDILTEKPSPTIWSASEYFTKILGISMLKLIPQSLNTEKTVLKFPF